MKSASSGFGGWAFNPSKAIIEAAKRGLAVVRTGDFLGSASATLAAASAAGASATHVALANYHRNFIFCNGSAFSTDVIFQRQEQMVLFLESILPCLDGIVEEEYEVAATKDDAHEFRKVFEDEVMWKMVDAELSSRPALDDMKEYSCGICGVELTNSYKQCLGCTVFAR